MPKDSIEIILTVQEARQDDIDRGIVRIENEFLKKLGLQQGDFVEIEGDKKTVAIAGRAYPADLGLGTIRMDPSTRKNAGTSISEKVKLRAINIKPAKKNIANSNANSLSETFIFDQSWTPKRKIMNSTC